MKSSLSIGIVGLPNVGKSTLFQLLTKKQVDCSNYPFCTIEPNVGIVAVPDERLDALVELLKPEKKIYATVEFVDIAGLVEGSHKGEGLGNQFLAHIREMDAIVYVLRGFAEESTTNVLGEINSLKEKEILDTELMLKDLQTLEKRLESLRREAKSGDKKIIKELALVERACQALEKGELLLREDWSEEERKSLSVYQLLTLKPCLYLINSPKADRDKFSNQLSRDTLANVLFIDALTELEAQEFSAEERKELGLPAQSAVDILIKEAYKLLDLISFFTILSNEVRAWPIKRGTKALQAGGIIHSDFEEKFIRAEVINWQNLIEAGGWTRARERGLIRTEGKEYVVQDGDVMEIKHS